MILLPHKSFEWSARVLSDGHLQQNMVTIDDVMRALLVDGYDSEEVNIWVRYSRALLAYQQATCFEWVNRGGDEYYWNRTRLLFLEAVPDPMAIPLILPPWIGYVDMHVSHQSYLIRSNPEHYGPKFPGISPNHDIVWPL